MHNSHPPTTQTHVLLMFNLDLFERVKPPQGRSSRFPLLWGLLHQLPWIHHRGRNTYTCENKHPNKFLNPESCVGCPRHKPLDLSWFICLAKKAKCQTCMSQCCCCGAPLHFMSLLQVFLQPGSKLKSSYYTMQASIPTETFIFDLYLQWVPFI